MTHPTDDELEAMAELLDRNGPSHVDADIWMSDAAAMLRACKTGDTALRECAGVGVRVKPLEWHGFSAAFIAYTIIGDYHVSRCGETWYWCSEEQDPYLEGTSAASEEAAFNAAQADYETRILSALEPSPSHHQKGTSHE